jgi:hypothetical protein
MNQLQQYTDPKLWGPNFWFVFRCIANNYPELPSEDDLEHVYTFFNEFQYILPCEICRESFKGHFIKYPLKEYLVNKKKLIEWVETIYNETDKKIKNAQLIEQKIAQPIEQKTQNLRQRSPPTVSRGCGSCNKNRKPIDPLMFPKSNEVNSGVNLGLVGGLRSALGLADPVTKNVLLIYYNWIKASHYVPSSSEAINIIRGYQILKKSSPIGFYPDSLNINGKDIHIFDMHILTNSEISKQIHDRLKRLSI